MRESDLVARLGGDEFALLLFFPEHGEEGMRVVLERTMQTLHKPIWLGYRQFVVTISLGVCICPLQGNTPEELLARSDEALYCAKASGRNVCAFWSPDGQHRIEKFHHRYPLDSGDRRRKPSASME
jgi:diguanylate cyclase (GGDEF)-like protein